jgi:hypothetical protein
VQGGGLPFLFEHTAMTSAEKSEENYEKSLGIFEPVIFKVTEG